MSELEDIKARAAERRKYHPGESFGFPAHDEAEADLAQTIAIAEELTKDVEYAWRSCNINGEQRDEARAAVLALRSFIESEFEYAEHDKNQNPVTMVVDVHADDCSLCEARRSLADTESYEQYR